MKNSMYIYWQSSTARRSQTLVWLCLLGLSVSAFICNVAPGQVIEKKQLNEFIQGPLLEESPFDLIFLDPYNREAILKIVPLKKEIKKPFPADGFLVFEFAEDSENLMQVPWNRVVDFKPYKTLIREEADNWMEQREFGLAFRNYLWLYDRGGRDDPQIQKALRTVLFEDGVESFRQAMTAVDNGRDAGGKFELALSIFEDIYRKDPKFRVKGIKRTLLQINMACYEGIVREYERKGDYEMIRGLLTQVSKSYEEKAAPLLAKWRKKFEEKSDGLLEQAEQYAEAGNGLAAHAAVRRANSIFPDRKATLRVYSRIVDKFPLVLVGVTQEANQPNPHSLDNWGDRRVGKMTQRSMVEFAGITDEGGKYEFLNGTISQIDDVGLEYRLEIQPNKSTFAVPAISAWEVSQRLQSYAEPSSENYLIPWAKILKTIAIENENAVSFSLSVPFVRPEALLQFPYKDHDPNGDPVLNGAYVLTAKEKELSTYELNPVYDPVSDRQHPTIIERRFRFSSEAVDAIVKGDIDVLDRVPLTDYEKLRRNRDVQVRPYVIPTLHMLVPNQRNEFVKDKNFRSGLLYGINRDSIVQDSLCGGMEINGCETVSGPFPRGTVDNDQISYGYELRVRNQPYEKKLGMVLTELITQSLLSKQREAGVQNPVVDRPPMVLVHPDDDVANIACRSIALMWREMGIETLVRQLKPGVTVPPDDDWDFLYMAVSSEEPLVDVNRILGKYGYAKSISAPIEQSLKKLSYSNGWQQSCSILRRIHRQVANDVTVLPLWQLTEFYAYRNNVTKLGRNLVHLYENLERWQIFPIDAEELNQP